MRHTTQPNFAFFHTHNLTYKTVVLPLSMDGLSLTDRSDLWVKTEKKIEKFVTRQKTKRKIARENWSHSAKKTKELISGLCNSIIYLTKLNWAVLAAALAVHTFQLSLSARPNMTIVAARKQSPFHFIRFPRTQPVNYCVLIDILTRTTALLVFFSL